MKSPLGTPELLRKQLYVVATMSPLSTIHVCFWALMMFSMGATIGFYLNESLWHTASTVHAKPAIQRDEFDMATPTLQSPIQPSEPTRKREVFDGLPKKFLTEVKMKPPATNFTLHPWRTASVGDHQCFAILLVKTAAPSFYARMLVRRTWGSISSINGERIAMAFLIGGSIDKFQQDIIENENSVYGDIIQGDVPDTYEGLPLKTLMGHQWVTEYYRNRTKYVITTDDDCFVSVVNTYDYFTHLPQEKTALGVHCGYILNEHGGRVNAATSKWFVSPNIYNKTMYPRFCHGGMVVMPVQLSTDIFKMSMVTNYTGFHLEDVLITGILRQKLDKNEQNIYSVMYKNKNGRRFPLVWHLLKKDVLSRIFNSLWTKAKMRFYVDDVSSADVEFNPLHAKVTLRDVPLPDKITKGGFQYAS